MLHQSKAATRTVFYIKNDEAGRDLLEKMRGALNKKNHRLLVRGRNENRKELAQQLTQAKQRYGNGSQPYWNGTHASLRQKVPLKHATYFAVYVLSPALDKERYAQWKSSNDWHEAKRVGLEEALSTWKYYSREQTKRINELVKELTELNQELVAATVSPSWRKVWKDAQECLQRDFHALIRRLGW